MAKTISYEKYNTIKDTVENYNWKPEYTDETFNIQKLKENLIPTLKKNIRFAIWLASGEPQTEIQSDAKAYLQKMINKIVEVKN